MKGRANSVFVQEKVMGAEETVHTRSLSATQLWRTSISQVPVSTDFVSHDPICCPGTPAVQVQ